MVRTRMNKIDTDAPTTERCTVAESSGYVTTSLMHRATRKTHLPPHGSTQAAIFRARVGPDRLRCQPHMRGLQVCRLPLLPCSVPGIGRAQRKPGRTPVLRVRLGLDARRTWLKTPKRRAQAGLLLLRRHLDLVTRLTLSPKLGLHRWWRRAPTHLRR